MNKARKGNAFQDWCVKWIMKNYPRSVCHNQKAVAKAIPIVDPKTKKREVRWVSQRNDIFGCIDLIWVLPDAPIIWVQCTTDQHIERKEKDLRSVPWPPNTNVQLWLKRPDKRVDIYNMTADNMRLVCSIVRGKSCLPTTFGSA